MGELDGQSLKVADERSIAAEARTVPPGFVGCDGSPFDLADEGIRILDATKRCGSMASRIAQHGLKRQRQLPGELIAATGLRPEAGDLHHRHTKTSGVPIQRIIRGQSRGEPLKAPRASASSSKSHGRSHITG